MKPRGAIQPAAGLQRHLGYWLRLVSNQVSGAFASALQGQNLSVAEWVALSQIHVSADLTPAALAGAMGMTRGAISKVLNRLQGKAWISRASSHADGRVQLLSLTRQGQRVLPDLARIADANDARFFGALDLGEQAALRRLLRKVAQTHALGKAPVD